MITSENKPMLADAEITRNLPILTLRVYLLVVSDRGWIVGRCELESSWIDDDSDIQQWSLSLPKLEWVELLWKWTHCGLATQVYNEELLWKQRIVKS